jgi:hypothetical protein
MSEKQHEKILGNNNSMVADRLPVLKEDQREVAVSRSPLSWAANVMEAEVGYVWTMEGYGVTLQISSQGTVRLLTVIDHPYFYHWVAMLSVTFEAAGIDFEMNSHAVIAAYQPGDEATTERNRGEPGMEVV